jgi:hypothetical protein
MQALIHRRLAKRGFSMLFCKVLADHDGIHFFVGGAVFWRIHEATPCLVLQKINIKIVVVVNAEFSVDKSIFFSKIKRLSEK